MVTTIFVEIFRGVTLDDFQARDGGPARQGDAEVAPARAGAEVRIPHGDCAAIIAIFTPGGSPWEPPEGPGRIPVERQEPPHAPALRRGEAGDGAEEGPEIAREDGVHRACWVLSPGPPGPGHALGVGKDLPG